MATTRSIDPLVWIDCEMTGLNPERDVILQIYCFITDSDLNLLDQQGWGAIISHPKSELDAMDEWCTRTHASTGLTAAVLASTTTPDMAANELDKYIRRHVPEPKKALLAGNSVHADKAFLIQPPYKKVMSYLHYRILDVSSIKEAVRRWAPDEAIRRVPTKKTLHEAREDILESIREAQYYKERFFDCCLLMLHGLSVNAPYDHPLRVSLNTLLSRSPAPFSGVFVPSYITNLLTLDDTNSWEF